VTRLSAFCVVLAVLASAPIWAQATTFQSLIEGGFFAHAYQDREYVHQTNVTFGVPYGAWGFEVEHRDTQGNVLGLDLAQTIVGSGSVDNFGQAESQPALLLNYGALYMGKDWGWWELDLGVSALLQWQHFDSESYLSPSGTAVSSRPSGMDWNHQESFTLINAKARFFPKEGPHLWVGVGRGPLSLTEDLFRFVGEWPVSWGLLSAEVSFSSPPGYFFSGSGVLRNNERLSFGWKSPGPYWSWGARVGFLVRPMVAGTGEVDLAQRWSISVLGTVNLPDRKKGDQRE